MESIRYFSLLILVVLASCTTHATVAVQVGSASGDAGVIADTEEEKTTAITEEEVPPEGSSNEMIPVDAAPPNATEESTPVNPVVEPAPPSDEMTPATPVDQQSSTDTNRAIKDVAI